MAKKIAIIAAHPDDEILGCGGTTARHSLAGDTVSVLILAEGVTSRDKARSPSTRRDDLSKLAKAAHAANAMLGVSDIKLHDFPDNRMDSVSRLDVVKVVEDFLQNCKPSVVYTHFANDLNVDHQVTHEAVVTACRPVPNSQIVTLLFFEVPSSTEWQVGAGSQAFFPSWYVEISSTLTKKMEALKAYSSEMRSFPHPRSLDAVEALARWRGASAGVAAAEAFVMGRYIDKLKSTT
jgi:LmbE family N-acetylglucosaminyl deacetylase